jgi:hypothetical protein
LELRATPAELDRAELNRVRQELGSLSQQGSADRDGVPDLAQRQGREVLGGLINEYERAAL